MIRSPKFFSGEIIMSGLQAKKSVIENIREN
nr:MAG TPA: hypothetical protein [Caudoviricetes sp.]